MASMGPDGPLGDGWRGAERASTQPHGALGQGCQVVVREFEVDDVCLERPGPAAHRCMGMDHANESDVTHEEPVPVRATRRRGEREGSMTAGLELHAARQVSKRIGEEYQADGYELDTPS